jgi:hypothetical protein
MQILVEAAQLSGLAWQFRDDEDLLTDLRTLESDPRLPVI